MGMKRNSPSSVRKILGMISKQSIKTKIFIGLLTSFVILVLLSFTRAYRHYYFYLSSQAVQSLGTFVLIYKLYSKKSCSGLSLKFQEINALFIAVKMTCSFSFELELHTWLDLSTLISTAWVIYMMRFKLKSTYNKELDNLPHYYVIVPAAILAVIVHPLRSGFNIYATLWAFAVYLDAIAVLPQLRLMQNAKMAEPFTGLYVFALGCSRFLGFAHWIFMIIETRGRYLHFWGYGSIWSLVNLIAELVQTFILGDFVYYYCKRVMAGQSMVLPLPV
ncbi:hypothetical protein ACHQM5_028450 [Ranunculus cassubicifolius]